MIVFLAENPVLERSLRRVLAVVPLGAAVATRSSQVPDNMRRVFTVGVASEGVILRLLTRHAEVINVTDGICKAIRLADVAEPFPGPRNATLRVAARQFHDQAGTALSPETLRRAVTELVVPLVHLGYIDQDEKDWFDQRASLPEWTDLQRRLVRRALRGQHMRLSELARAPGGVAS